MAELPESQNRPELVPLLRELDEQEKKVGMPLGAANRISLAIRDHEAQPVARWRRWLPAASFLAGAAVALGALAWGWSAGPTATEPRPLATVSAPRVAVAGFSTHGDCTQQPGRTAGAVALAGDCRLEAEHMQVQVWERAEVAAHGRDVQVASGEVLFDVDTVAPGETPVRVRVSHGVIEVVGTRFSVVQDDAGGHVDLFEGHIRFHDPSGEVVEVTPGERHAWGAHRVAVADVAPPPSAVVEVQAAEPPVAEAVDLAATRAARRQRNAKRASVLIARVTELRARKAYGEATDVLRQALKRRWDRRTAQVLSYELGELLRSAGDVSAACGHFAAHQRRYPAGRYHAAVETQRARLACEPGTEP